VLLVQKKQKISGMRPGVTQGVRRSAISKVSRHSPDALRLVGVKLTRRWRSSQKNSEVKAEDRMAKYYVQSGNVRTLISAEDTEKAALWAVHCAMRQVVPVYDDEELSPEQKNQLSLVSGVRVLGNIIRISELGFDREDAAELDTFELLVQWHQLMLALARLEAMSRTAA